MRSESAVTNDVLLAVSKRGIRLYRNNSGAITTDDGRHIRFGLGNISTKVNRSLKSSDLIGVTPVVIKPEHLGRTLGIFTSLEIKHGGWKLQPSDDHAQAQLRWIELIRDLGGIAGFVSDVAELDSIIYFM